MKVEGRNAVRELILNGATIDKVIIQNNLKDGVISEIVDLLKSKKIRLLEALLSFLIKSILL